MKFQLLSRMASTTTIALAAMMAQAITIDMVPVGDPGNSGEQSRLSTYGDTNYYGAVGYNFNISKTEITAGQYAEFLTEVAGTSDSYGLYNPNMAVPYGGSQITKTGDVYTAALPNQPVNYVSWGDVARFCNWLQTGDTETGAYTLNGHTDVDYLLTVTRNPGATYAIPTENEWYKAAYYDPNKGGTGVGGYWRYPTKSNAAPTNVYPSSSTNNATYYNNGYTLSGPPGTTPVGSFANSLSAYGTLDQGGNVWEWNETVTNSAHGMRGGALNGVAFNLSSSDRGYFYTTSVEFYNLGFRVVSIPEPVFSLWKGPGGGSFTTASNWTNNTVPNGVGATANFVENITTPSTVTLDSPVTLGIINFDSDQSYTIAGTSPLTLQVSSGTATNNAEAGIHEISVPVFINSDTIISGAGTLDLFGGVTGDHVLTVLGSLSATSIEVESLIIGTAGATAVPEPSAFALLVIGGIGLIAWGWRRRKQAVRLMALCVVAFAAGVGIVRADVFNMGSGLTSLELVPVRDINNQADTQVMQWGDGTTGYGSVGHAYSIGKYEVTAAQFTEFLNAVAADDTHELYSPYMDASFNIYGCNIKRSGVSGSYTYSVLAEWANRPVNWVTWGDSARFVNWLNNGRPSGPQGPQTTEDGAYLLNGAMNDTELMAVQAHKPGAKCWLPTENEWYKAAYYKGGSTNAGYWLYPTQSDSAPGRDMTETTKPGNNLNSYGYPSPIEPGHYATVGGEFQLSDSAYGTFDQGGNVMEWNEAVVWDSSRGLRGGSFNDYDWDYFVSTYRYSLFPSRDAATIGFRIAAVPEPSTIVLLLTASLGGLLWWRRR